MIWAGVIGGIMVDPWKVPDGIKMTSNINIVSLREQFKPMSKKQRILFRRTIIFMQKMLCPKRRMTLRINCKNKTFSGPRKIN